MNFQERYEDTCSTVAIAARHGDLDTMRDLINQGRPTDVMDNRGWRSIHEAAFYGHVDCLRILLNQEDAEVDSNTFAMQTALYMASLRAHTECVKALLAAGANPNASTREDLSPLWEACDAGNLECVKLLVEAGAHVNHKIYTNDTPLHSAVKGGHPEIADYLIKKGADIRKVADEKLTPLFLSAQFGTLECMKILIDFAKSKGESFLRNYVNKAAGDRASPLWLASQNGHVGCAQLLIDCGANPHQYVLQDGVKLYPLQAASELNRPGCLQLLLKYTDPKLFGWPFGEYEHENITSLLLHPIVASINHQEEDCFRLLMDAGWLNNRCELEIQWADLFLFGMQLRSAVLFVKWCQKTVGHDMVGARLWVNNDLNSIREHRTNTCIMPLESFVLLLQTFEEEVYNFVKDMFVQGTCDICFCESHTGMIVAVIKTIVGKGYDRCIEFGSVYCSDHLRKRPPYQIMETILVLCLFPNIYNSAIEAVLRNSLSEIEHEIERTISDDFEQQWNKEAEVLKAIPTSLQHLCRLKIVHSLMANNAFTRTNIDTLILPSLLKSYLQYKEFGVVGEEIMDAFEAVVEAEKKVEETMASVHLTEVMVETERNVEETIADVHLTGAVVETERKVEETIADVHLTEAMVGAESKVEETVADVDLTGAVVGSDRKVEETIAGVHLTEATVETERNVEETIADEHLTGTMVETEKKVEETIADEHLTEAVVETERKVEETIADEHLTEAVVETERKVEETIADEHLTDQNH